MQILSNEVPYHSEDNLESIDKNDEDVSDLDNFSNLCTENLLDDFLENIDNENFTKIISEFDNPLDKNISLINVEEYPTIGTTNDSTPAAIVAPLLISITTNVPVKITRSQKRKKSATFLPTTTIVHKPTLKSKPKKQNIKWQQKNLTPIKSSFTVNSFLPDEIMCLETPLQIFRYFFSDDLIAHIVFESNRYSKQVDPNNTFSITCDDIKKCLGICTIMSVAHVSDIRKYWSPNIGNEIIQNTICCNNFEKIKSLLHFSDDYSMLPKDHPGHDRLYKIRPVVETLKNKFGLIPL